MTTDPMQGERKMLWSDEAIINLLTREPTVFALLVRIRNDYEQELAAAPPAMTEDEITHLLGEEILWCERNPDSAFHPEYRKGFVNGLIQARYIVGKYKSVREKEAANAE